tara:strand:+ start:1679 stop:2836 length:1158 start_codon:yes stop_codon:yes gene_type:complete
MFDLKSCFYPIENDLFEKSDWFTTQIGSNIDFHSTEKFPDFKFAEVAFLSINEYEGSDNSLSNKPCKIRKELYELHIDNSPRICDLGNLKLADNRKESFKIIENVCKELIFNGIIPVIIKGGQDISYAVYKSYSGLKKNLSISVVDNCFDIGHEKDMLSNKSFFGKILSTKPNTLFNYSNIGYQSFYVSNIALEMLDSLSFDAIRLGDVKASISSVEPILRNTDFLSFDLSSIQNIFAPANRYGSPNGFNGEEACQIMRYAGISDKLSCLAISEYDQDLDIHNQTAKLISQMIWYFLLGYRSRKNELNPNVKNCIKYTVSFEDGKNEIVFYKSNLSGRWWMGVPFKSDIKNQLDCYYVACSYLDYEIANKGEVPEKWIKTFNKLS